MATISDCKYGCGKKLKYDTVRFSHGFTVSIPWVRHPSDVDLPISDSSVLALNVKKHINKLYLFEYNTYGAAGISDKNIENIRESLPAVHECTIASEKIDKKLQEENKDLLIEWKKHYEKNPTPDLSTEYDQMQKHIPPTDPSYKVNHFIDDGNFEGALSYLKENIDDLLHSKTWFGTFRELSQVFQKLARYDDALHAIELQILISGWDWDYFQLANILVDMDRGFDAIDVLDSVEKRLSEWNRPFDVYEEPRTSYWLFSQFIYAYRNVGNAPKEQEYIEKSIEFEKKGFSDIEIQMKHREDLAKCLLKQGKFKYASTALEQANKLRDELGSQKPVKKREQEKDFVGKGFDDPFPNMSEDDYIGTLEFKFRNLIMNKLMKLPNWEKERVPPKEWQAAIELKKTSESDPVLLDHEKRIIDYVDFSDYIKIFQHKKNWDKIFQPVFRDSDLFFGQLKILQKFRNPIAHHRGNKLRRHLSEPAHGQLEQIYNYFMWLMQRDEDRNQPLEVD